MRTGVEDWGGTRDWSWITGVKDVGLLTEVEDWGGGL